MALEIKKYPKLSMKKMFFVISHLSLMIIKFMAYVEEMVQVKLHYLK